MKNAITIFCRDFTAYFTSPIGYIYMIVFLLISVGLYMTTFFVFPVADMRNFFGNMPLMLCIFIPAVTMRVWAEERKENTWEMLLTFPMKSRELVLGKFLATLAFFGLTLLATGTLPIMLINLGNPDMGPILGGYFGTFLLGAFFLAIGIFVSGFCKDQIVAFVVTLLVCFATFLVGTNFVESYLNNMQSGLGTLLSDALGVMNHYTAFARGVVEVGDILYFVVWTALFLGLNMWFIEGRNRPGARLTFGSATAICIGIGLAFNTLISGQSLGRFDLTEHKIYTVSPASRSILQSLEAPAQVNLYITPREDMPTQLNRLEQDITDKLEELRLASGGNLRYSIIPMRAANVIARGDDMLGMDEPIEPDDESRALEERMLDKGVRPFEYQDLAEDQITTTLVYSSIGIAYRDYPEEIIPRIVPENMDELEYLLMNIIFKMSREVQPLVALMAPEDAVPEEMRQLYAQLGQQAPPSVDPYSFLEMLLEHEKYDVERIRLTQHDPIPDDADVLVVVNPRQLNERQLYEINRALVSGIPVVLAVQEYEWDYQIVRDRLNLHQEEINPKVNPLLESYGLRVSQDILMDANHFPLQVASGDGLAAMLGVGQPITLPMHIIVTGASMDPETSITSALSSVLYLWGTALELDEAQLQELDLDYRVLMSTSERAWTIPRDAPSDMLHAALTDTPERGSQYPLMVMVQGQFPDAYADQPRPAWPPEQPRPGMPPEPPGEEVDPEPITPEPSSLVLIGGARMFSDDFLRSGEGIDLFMNTIDAMALGEELLDIRSRRPTDRLIQRPDARTRMFWQVVNYGLMNVIIAGVGLGVFVVRRQSRNAYTMSFNSVNPKA